MGPEPDGRRLRGPPPSFLPLHSSKTILTVIHLSLGNPVSPNCEVRPAHLGRSLITQNTAFRLAEEAKLEAPCAGDGRTEKKLWKCPVF